MEYFRRLGARLHDGWTAQDRDEERFPEVAAQALRELPPADHFDRDAFLRDALEAHGPGTQHLAPAGAFGQPGITAFHGEGFVVEVYYWLDSASAIHNHPFCGLFAILEGYSVHAEYRAEERERIGPAWIGDIALDRIELLAQGDVRLFSLREHPLVHALIHVPVPSISLVLRTVRTEGYLRYLPPTLALPMGAPADPLARRLSLLESMGHAGDPAYPAALDRFMGQADFETSVRVLSSLWARSDDEHRAAWIEALRARFGARVDALAPALDFSLRLGELAQIRAGLADPDLRLVSIVLTYAETREQVLAALGQRVDDPAALLHRFVDEAGLFAPDEEASAIIAHALVDDVDAMARLAGRYGDDAVREKADEVARYCATSIFGPLSR
jgi:hypothetical protein